MFSALRRYPRFDVRLKTNDPVPRWVSREFRSSEWLAKDAVRRAQNAYVLSCVFIALSYKSEESGFIIEGGL